MQVKVSETTPVQINWLVAKCEGYVHTDGNIYLNYWSPSTDWSQAGPIIERECLTLYKRTGKDVADQEQFQAVCGHNNVHHQGKRGATYLIAAMRCFIASKLGDIVEVPEELV